MASRSLEALVDAAAQDKRRGSQRSNVGQMAAMDESQLDSLSELKRKFKDVLRAYWRQHKASHEGEDTDQYEVAHRIATSIFNLYWDKPNYAGLRPEKKEILNYFVKHIQLSKSREGQSSNPLLRSGVPGPNQQSRSSFSETDRNKASRDDELYHMPQRKRSIDQQSLHASEIAHARLRSETINAAVIPRAPEVLRTIREIIPESQLQCSLLIDGAMLQVPEHLVRSEIVHYLLTRYGVGCLVCVLNIGGPLYHILLASPEEADQLAGQLVRFSFSLAPHVLYRIPNTSSASLASTSGISGTSPSSTNGGMSTPSISTNSANSSPSTSLFGTNAAQNISERSKRRGLGELLDFADQEPATKKIKLLGGAGAVPAPLGSALMGSPALNAMQGISTVPSAPNTSANGAAGAAQNIGQMTPSGLLAAAAAAAAAAASGNVADFEAFNSMIKADPFAAAAAAASLFHPSAVGVANSAFSRASLASNVNASAATATGILNNAAASPLGSPHQAQNGNNLPPLPTGALAASIAATLGVSAANNNNNAMNIVTPSTLSPSSQSGGHINGEDHFVVEKVLHQRSVQGKVQYLLQLKGSSNDTTSNAIKVWMFDEDIFGEVEKRKKHENLTTALTSGVFPDASQLPDVEQILGAKLLGSQVMFYVKWANCPVYALVPSTLINAAAPAKVIQFYEARLSFEKHQAMSGVVSPVVASPPTSPGSLSTTVPNEKKIATEV